MIEKRNIKTYCFDGAFGTYYHKITGSTCNCESANINDPERVKQIHHEYIEAGVNAIKTNTFNTSETEVIEAGYRLANEAKGVADVDIFADIGYISGDDAEVYEKYIDIVNTFMGMGTTNYLFETLEEIEPIIPSVNLIRTKISNAVIMISFAVSPDGYTRCGKYYKDLILEALHCGADIIGLNCVCGPTHILNLLSKLDIKIDDVNISAMPNAGYPLKINSRLEYNDNPEYFSDKMCEIRKLGVTVLGGCCGTTPAHIKLTIEKFNMLDAPRFFQAKNQETASDKKEIKYSPLKRNIDKFNIAVELDPPLDTDIDFLIKSASKLKSVGVDLITLADSPLARARADSIMLASKVKRETGIDTLPHLACRDKNSIAIKGALIASNIENVQNILVVTGDSIKSIDNSRDNVFSFNSLKLISYIKSLNNEMFSNSPFCIAGALNINAVNFRAELKRAADKVKNGAEILLTQAIFSDESVENLIMAHNTLCCKLYAGVLPIASYRNAVFLNNEVPGITVPIELISKLEGKTPDETHAISVAYSKSIIDRIKPYCDGIYIMTPLKKIDLVCELVKYIKSII